MANFSAPAPSEDTKAAWLHDRSRIPAAPPSSRADVFRRYLPLTFGILLALGAEALAFQTRASWSSGREWVVPATTPLLVIGGLALGHLVARGKLNSVSWPAGFVLLAIIFTIFNIWRGTISSGADTGRNVLTVLTAILLGVSVAWLMLTLLITEVKDPTRAPTAPEA